MRGATRFSARFQEFREKNQFTDMKYIYQGTPHYVHRLILARESSFFDALIRSKAAPSDSTQSCPLPLESPNKIDTIVDFMYTRRFSISATDCRGLAETLVTAAFYGVNSLVDLVKEHIQNILQTTTSDAEFSTRILELTKPFAHVVTKNIENITDLIEAGRSRISEVEDIFKEVVSSRIDDLMSNQRAELAASVSPQLLAHALKASNHSSLDKIIVIEMFLKESEITDMSKFENFNEVVNWDEPGITDCFLKYSMSWAWPRITRREIGKILQRRKAILDNLKGETKEKIGRWDVSERLKEVSDGSGCEEIDLVKHISTCGGLANQIDPVKIGWIDVKEQPALDQEFMMNSIFDGGTFVSWPETDSVGPDVGVVFGDVHAWVRKVVVCDSLNDLGRRIGNHRIACLLRDTVSGETHRVDGTPSEDKGMLTFEFERPCLCNELTFTGPVSENPGEENPKGGMVVWRISSISAYGHFYEY